MSFRGAIARALYTAAWFVFAPLVALYLCWRGRRQPAYRRYWRERFLGRGARPAGGGPVLWIHAVSLGETRAAEPLIAALARRLPAATFVLTHMTPTGRDAGAQIAAAWPGRIVQRYLPYDLPPALKRFLRETGPALGVLMETEFWPNLLFAAHAAGVPVVLANARLSVRSAARAKTWRLLARAAARAIKVVAAQTDADRDRIRALFDGPIEVVGNLKFDIAPDPDAVARGRQARAASAGGPVWMAASTRDGEEALIVAAFQRWRAANPAEATDRDHSGTAPRLLIVPRHPQRFDEVARVIAAHGLAVRRRSASAEIALPESDDSVFLGDSMGEMSLYYGLADAAIIGGSLLPYGAQNLIEACGAGVPVILGPSVYNFAQAAADALAAGAAIAVDDADAAMTALAALAADTRRRDAMAAAARVFAAAHRGATVRTAALIEAIIQKRTDAPTDAQIDAPTGSRTDAHAAAADPIVTAPAKR